MQWTKGRKLSPTHGADAWTAVGALLALLFACSGASQAAQSLPDQNRRGGPGQAVQCPVDEPADYGEIPDTAEESAAADEEDEDEDDAGSETGAGGFAVGPQTCVFPSLDIVVGNKMSSTRTSATRFTSGSIKTQALDPQLSTTFGMVWVDRSFETPLVTKMTVQAPASGDPTLSEASISNSLFAVGLLGSRFDAWAGDEFSLKSIAPSQSPAAASLVAARGKRSIALISIEDPTFRRVALTGYGANGAPDVIARWAGRFGPSLSLTLSAATHETRLDDGGAFRGFAGLASLKYDLAALGEDSYVLLQASAADKAIGYLGVHTTSNVYGFSLQGKLSAQSAERSRGVSGAAVGVFEITPKWRLGAYATAAKLTLPEQSRGEIFILRTAANVQWTPVKPLAIGLEAGYATARSQLPNLPTASGFSLVIAMTRSL